MKKLQSRAIICLFFAAILILGTGFYIFKFVKDGKQWISFPSNKHIYQNGKLSTGTIKDRSGRVIAVSYTHLDVYKRQNTFFSFMLSSSQNYSAKANFSIMANNTSTLSNSSCNKSS